MTIPELWMPGWTASLINHILQSTIVTLVAWLLTLALRANTARVRYAIWTLASIKFLLPFKLLTSIGNHWAKPLFADQPPARFFFVVEQFNQPFRRAVVPDLHSTAALPAHIFPIAALLIATVWLSGFLISLTRWISGWRRAATLTKRGELANEGREFDTLRLVECRMGIRKRTPLIFSSRDVEPGIFGAFRPVLLWPTGLSSRLENAHIEAIMVHEVEHIRRRDNLTAAIHVLVEALFWFHPLVRWMGAKMNEEREQACDEKVIEQHARPEAYAESILKVCTFCVESPLPCVAGISGPDLRNRVLRIMSHQSGASLTLERKALLIGAAALALTLPIGFGMVRGQAATVNLALPNSKAAHKAPQFDVVSIKPTPSSDDKVLIQLHPDGTSFHGAPVRMVLQTAFGLEDDLIIGVPSWANTDRYDIEAKVAPEDAPKLDTLKAQDRNAMLIPVLVERLHLKYHHEARERSTYVLVVAKGGPKLTQGVPFPSGGLKPSDPKHPEDPAKEHFKVMTVPGDIEADSVPMYILADQLTRLNALGRTVVDKTGLAGNYNFRLRWTPDNLPFPIMADPEGVGAAVHSEKTPDSATSSLFTAVQEQLGLKLEAAKATLDVIVIDHIDRPSKN